MNNMGMRKEYIEGYYDTATDTFFSGAYCFSIGGKNLLIYNGFTLLLDDYLTESLRNKQADSDLMFKIIQSGLKVDDGNHQNKNDIVESFIIDITTKCNMACKYCLREKNQESSSISDETLEKICCYIKDYCHEKELVRIYIQPWGGEPMLEYKKILFIYDYFKDHNIYAHIGIMSNGTIAGNDIIDELEQKHIGVGISIDGCSEIQKKQRVFHNGVPSFERVVENIELFKKSVGQDFGTASVVTANTFDLVEQNVDFFCKELGVKNIRMTLVDENPNHNNHDMCLSPAQIKEFYTRYIKKLVSIIEEGYVVKDSFIASRLLNLLNRSISNACTSKGCLGGRCMVFFDREGNIYPCKQTDYKSEMLGSIDSGMPLDMLLQNAWETNPFFNEKKGVKCKECPWNSYCKGGCTCRVMISQSGTTDITECVINNTLYPLLIELMLTKPEVVNVLVGFEIM